MNQVFLDFENVPRIDFSVFEGRQVTFTLLIGPKQEKLDAALVEKLIHHAASLQIVRLSTSGRSALDFALSYYLGRAALTDPTAYFHIISRDKGFDSLIEHLRSRHIKARRHDDFSTLTFSATHKTPAVQGKKPVPRAKDRTAREIPQPPSTEPAEVPSAPTNSPASPSEKGPDPDSSDLENALVYLRRKKPANRPRRLKALASDLRSHFGKDLTDDALAELVADLAEEEHISFSDTGDVTYHLDSPEPGPSPE